MTGAEERLGRRINGNSNRKKVVQVVKKKRSMLPSGFFKPDRKGDVSFDKLVNEPIIIFLTAVAEAHNDSFKGWAVLSAEELRTKGFDVVPSPSPTNPHHVHVPLADWGNYGHDRSYNLDLARCIVAFQRPLS